MICWTPLTTTGEGSPATFELTRAGGEDTTYAEAGKLRYDLKSGTIEFSENATITEGGNQISSSFLVYNILEQRINAQSSGDGENRVKIIYTPRNTENSDDSAELDAVETAPNSGSDEDETGREGEDDGS